MQQQCASCRSRFFADEEDLLSGSWFCSYCMPYVQTCPICHTPWKGQRRPKYQIRLCNHCQGRYRPFTNRNLTERYLVFVRDNFSCRYCGRSPIEDATVVLEIDHLEPQSITHDDTFPNYVTACRECNAGKCDLKLEEYWIDVFKSRKWFTPQDSTATGKRVEQVEDC